jgi:hypothetical protein
VLAVDDARTRDVLVVRLSKFDVPSVFYQIIRQQHCFRRQIVSPLHISSAFCRLGLLHILSNLIYAVLLAQA